MKTTLSYLFIVLYTFVSCQEKSVINDLQFSNYSGHPKKVTEFITFSTQNTNKSISYFDKEGFLTKIEYYNATQSESPNERFIDQIITYNSKDKTKRYFETVNSKNKKVESNGYFEKISDSVYRRISNTVDHKMSLNKLLYFDKNNRLIKTGETGTFYGTPINNIIFYTYINGEEHEMLIEDVTNHKKSKLTSKNVKLDAKSNPVYIELTDEYGTVQQKIEREFEYY
ncbi:hypothetical protein EG344_19240 [Chryseobacterium sp. G0162]|uniref:hypothetical protein n=1 Tax=Chryseobacterium sp. G0162 TaxID=2487063 RepID=UPI000F4D8165|nr:hypothetical protein [Chryseobacterium sp. G0162]AZB10818.1 hypothetical protein EG344_19240 [Chryseobacterium sp. G0162]